MVKIPYGSKFLEFDERSSPVLRSRIDRLKSRDDGQKIVRAAMAKPISSPKLSELAKGKRSCVIIISDHTRPVPSRDILPPMLDELREGSPEISITLLVATGFHRGTSEAELMRKLGCDIMRQANIRVHDCRDAASNVDIGVLPSGARLVVDRCAVEAELLLAEGFIEPHFFAGFSGGRKSVLPGICDQVTVMGNHCSRFIDSPFARAGVLDGNPLHIDMLAAARMAKLAYIVNVIIDEDKNIVAAFAGDFEQAHRQGCDYLLGFCRVEAVPADIVITSNGGAPLDQNIYQCVKAMTAAEASCLPGGVIILCAECLDGHGGEGFYRALRDCESPAELYARYMATPQSKTVPDQWESQILARILKKHTVIMVTRPELQNTVEKMKMNYAPTISSAVSMARSLGKNSITVIPNGISVIVESTK